MSDWFVDIEKTINGLENLREICKAKSDMSVGEGKFLWACYENAVEDAISLLKEQEAKKVLQIRNVAYRTIGYCPSCGRGLDSYEDGNSGDHITNYCYNCGQAVKWNDD